jgi:hypothetical protein
VPANARLHQLSASLHGFGGSPLLDTYPVTFNVNGAVLAATTDTVNDCAQAYTSCAGDSLAEQEISDLVEVIRLDLDVCTATVRLISRQTEMGLSDGVCNRA